MRYYGNKNISLIKIEVYINFISYVYLWGQRPMGTHPAGENDFSTLFLHVILDIDFQIPKYVPAIWPRNCTSFLDNDPKAGLCTKIHVEK